MFQQQIKSYGLRDIDYQLFGGVNVHDSITNVKLIVLVDFEESFDKIGIFKGIPKITWKMRRKLLSVSFIFSICDSIFTGRIAEEEKPQGKSRKGCTLQISTIKIEDIEGILKHESKMFEILRDNKDATKLLHSMDYGFLAKKVFMLVGTPEGNMLHFAALVVTRTRTMLHLMMQESPKKHEKQFIMDLWVKLVNTIEILNFSKINKNEKNSVIDESR